MPERGPGKTHFNRFLNENSRGRRYQVLIMVFSAEHAAHSLAELVNRVPPLELDYLHGGIVYTNNYVRLAGARW